MYMYLLVKKVYMWEKNNILMFKCTWFSSEEGLFTHEKKIVYSSSEESLFTCVGKSLCSCMYMYLLVKKVYSHVKKKIKNIHVFTCKEKSICSCIYIRVIISEQSLLKREQKVYKCRSIGNHFGKQRSIIQQTISHKWQTIHNAYATVTDGGICNERRDQGSRDGSISPFGMDLAC